MQRMIFDSYELLTQWPDLGPSASWLGQVAKNNALVSVRFVPAAIARDKDSLRLYHTPAKRLRALDHPNLARLYEANVNNDGYFIISEFVRGESLAAVMRHALGEVTLELSSVLSMMVALTGAVVSLHEAGDHKGRPTPVIHGALWPGHVMLTYGGELKLTGSAHTQADSLLRGPALEGGNIEYEAPEIFLGQPRTPQSNVFSLGVILWELLAGRRLFDHDQDAFDAMQAICEEEVPPPSVHRSDCPPMLDMLVLKMVAKKPEARLSNASSALRALKQVGAKLGLKSQLGATIQMLLTSRGYFDERIQDWKAVFDAEAHGDKDRVIRHARALFIEKPERATQEMEEGDLSSLLDTQSEPESTYGTALNASGKTKHLGPAPRFGQDSVRSTFLNVSGKASRKPESLQRPPFFGASSTHRDDPLNPATWSLNPLVMEGEESFPTLDPPEACDAPTVEGSSLDLMADEVPSYRWGPVSPASAQEHEADTRELMPLEFGDIPVSELTDGAGTTGEIPVATAHAHQAPDAWYFGDDEAEPDLFHSVFSVQEILGDTQPAFPELTGHQVFATSPVAQVLRLDGTRVLKATTLRPSVGQSLYRPEQARVEVRLKRAKALMRRSPGTTGWVKKKDAQAPEPLSEEGGEMELVPGDQVELFDGLFTYRIRVFFPPLPPAPATRVTKSRSLTFFALAALASLVFHGLALFGVFAIQEFSDIQMSVRAAPDQAEVFAEGKLSDLEKPLAVPKPKSKRVKFAPTPPTVDPTEQTPAIPKSIRKEIAARMARKSVPKDATKAEKIAAALASPNPGSGQAIKDVVTNIDAIKAPGGASSGSFQALAKVSGGLSRGDVYKEINRHMGAIRMCYERELMKTPTLAGKITFEWSVKTKGRVFGLRERSSTLRSAKVSGCIKDIIAGMTFPSPKGGSVSISYPFIFSST